VPIFFHEDEEPKGKARDLPRLALAAVRFVAEAGRRQLIVMLAMEAASAVLLGVGVLLARDVLQAVLDADKAGSGWRDVLPSLAGLAAVSVATTVASAIARRQDQMLAELVSRHAWARILDVTCSAELAAFDDAGFHDLIMRAQRGAFQAGQVVRGLLGLAQAATGVVAGLIALAVLQPLLLPVCAVAAVPSVWLARRRSRSYYGFAFRMTARDRERAYLASLLSERDAAKEIRAMDLAGFLRARHDRLYGERIEELDDLTRRQLRWALVAGVAGSGIVAATVAVLVALALGGQLSIADAAAAGGAMIVFGQRVAAGGMASQMLLESALFLEDYLTFAELAPGPEAPGEAPAPRRAEGAIAAEEVWFSYPGSDRPALRGASLRIGPGEVIALVGPNGSGKTTLAKLMAGLYVPERGRVLLHGSDTTAADRPVLRRDVAVVFQDFLRYWLPVRDNIAMGRHEHFRDGERVAEAARRAGADHDIEALPDGYDTQLGPVFAGGADLSVGQWQKIAIARLFFRDAPFVILDEPTAALDARAEHELFARIRELLEGRAVLLISHRFSTVREADRIYVLEAGAVVEEGSHQELMALEGTYAEMFTLQAAAYAS
jgi:ABC-type multidrug transport system fused ATPase/permease subunit